MIKIGNITMTHGIKGELKLYSNFSKKEQVIKKGCRVFIENKEHQITSVRFHKNHYLITLDEKKDINLVEEFRKKDVFIAEKDIVLENEEIILELLIGYEVVENEEKLGKVTDIMYNNGGILLKVSGKNPFYIPYNEYFVKEILQADQKIMTEHTKELIL